jgi:hypothetical protein
MQTYENGVDTYKIKEGVIIEEGGIRWEEVTWKKTV